MEEELLGQVVEEVFYEAVVGNVGVCRKGPGEQTTVGLLNGTDETAGYGDLGEVKAIFLCD